MQNKLKTMLFGIDLKKNIFLKWLFIFMAIFFIFSITITAIFLNFEKKYANKIYPGIRLGQLRLGGRTKEGAEKLLNQKINEINQNGFKFKYNNRETTITPTISSFEVDLAYQIITFDVKKTVEDIFNFGRKKKFFSNLQNKFLALISEKPVKIIYNINEEEIKKILKSSYGNAEIPTKNAELIATSSPLGGGEISFEINEEKLGKIMDYDKAVEELKINLDKLESNQINIISKTDYPTIHKSECLNIKATAAKILANSPLTLIYQDKKWIIEKEALASWLALKDRRDDNHFNSQDTQTSITVALNSEKLKKFIEEKMSAEIDKEPINARFEIKDGRVMEFQGSQDGLKIAINKNIEKIQTDFAINGVNTVELITEEIKSTVQADDLNDLGIKEIIGIGSSNFSGSPANRRRNIRTGALALNGVLIKPEEEFSTVKTLGEVNADSGYLPELVIKGNKTIPEYGGGLCQIGTTIFRAALDSGLPITARRSHSYRVSYYEPAGTDATIYSPAPDLKFINDTKNYILIQTRVEGDNLYFDFWGTKDGRIVEKTNPTIYNIVKPGPTKIIETFDLPVGEKKCTEKAHNGADAYFDYKVTYPISAATSTPAIKERKFSSHYVPWQEVCLVGVEKLAEIKEDEKEENKINEEEADKENSEIKTTE